MAGRRFGRPASSLRQCCGVLPASSVHASPKYNVLTQGNERVPEVGDQKGMPRASFPFGHYNTSGASGRTPVHIEIGKVEIQSFDPSCGWQTGIDLTFSSLRWIGTGDYS